MLELDNNVAERGMRAIALGRKNYLFVVSATLWPYAARLDC